ncbi:MAG: DHHA1 domain-containing protein [Thermoanaerobaculia bacterium]|nr:DHHA1 domain-containing protein [Thermoanaerobaculia bacterium]
MNREEREASLERLAGFLEDRHEGRWLVLTHDNPDPDAIASAHGMSILLRKAFGFKVTIGYGGIIGRAENREMVRTLKLKMSHLRYLNLDNYVHFALVDTQPRTGNNQLPDEIVPDLVLDHHPERKATREASFADVRPEYGATATMVAEYLLASGAKMTGSDVTALVYAIRAETRDFGRESSGPDRAVYDLLYPDVNKPQLAKIQHPRLPLTYFKTLHEALERLETVDTLIVSHLGTVAQPDIVPEIADLLLRLEGKTWSLCTGRFEDRIHLSVRTTNPRADAGNIMRKLVRGAGRGGGHGMTAGGWVALEDEEALEAQQRQLAEALAAKLNKNPSNLAPLPLQAAEI